MLQFINVPMVITFLIRLRFALLVLKDAVNVKIARPLPVLPCAHNVQTLRYPL